MDSIDQNQKEKNYQDLNADEATKKIKHIIDHTKTCFFCTSVNEECHTRPMSVQQVDDAGNLWFLSADDSHKNLELATEPAVRLYFQGSEHSDFLYLDGFASISRDQEKIKELWNFLMSTWFTDGIDDPRITVIKVTPTHGYYWDNKHGNAIAGIKMFFGALAHKTMDDSMQGNINV